MSGFGGLVDKARRGAMSRRGFLSAALALGVGAEEALRELPRKIISAPKLPELPAITADLITAGVELKPGDRVLLTKMGEARLNGGVYVVGRVSNWNVELSRMLLGSVKQLDVKVVL